ncbi:hypothetical protein JL720_8860 [Aureococcus anophagefferens]|nr:hypothetical protein JL720_8860 [Aureococcus anophagefferens]
MDSIHSYEALVPTNPIFYKACTSGVAYTLGDFVSQIYQGRNLKDVWEDVKATSWPALRSSWRFWPFVHTISFSHLVPLDLKLLWVDAMEIVWVTILSKVANDDKVAKLDEDPEAAGGAAPGEGLERRVDEDDDVGVGPVAPLRLDDVARRARLTPQARRPATGSP